MLRRRRVGARLMDKSTRPWQVLLLGGASGPGKTRLSYRRARELSIGISLTMPSLLTRSIYEGLISRRWRPTSAEPRGFYPRPASARNAPAPTFSDFIATRASSSWSIT